MPDRTTTIVAEQRALQALTRAEAAMNSAAVILTAAGLDDFDGRADELLDAISQLFDDIHDDHFSRVVREA